MPGERLARAATDRQRVMLATGHPVGLALLYHAIDREQLVATQGQIRAEVDKAMAESTRPNRALARSGWTSPRRG